MTDEEWIEERLKMDGVVAVADDMRAALARGREEGRASCEYERELLDITRRQRDGVLDEVKRLRREIADDYQNVMAPLVDMLGKAVQDTHFAWSGHALDAARALIAERDRLREDVRREREHARAFSADIKQALMERAEKAEADRDRLAKRVADLESRLTIANAAEAHARAQVDGYHAIGATTRLAGVERRLATLEQQVVHDAFIAQEAAKRVEELTRNPGDIESRLAALRAPETSTLATVVDALVTDQNAELAERDAALATARRERDEAVGVLRRWINWRNTRPLISGDGDEIERDARALVAGEAAPDHRNEGPGGCVPWEEAERLRASLAAAEAELAKVEARR